jgi:diacylglycerol O-acyltransferase / wax synthase
VTAPVRMSNVDAAWLGMDSPDNLMMVTAVLHLDEPVDRERLEKVLWHRLLARYPKFSMRPLPTRSPFEQPVWTDDPDFDLRRHVVDAGPCADDAALAALVSDLLGRPLDMRWSPWQFHLVDVPGPAGAPPTSALVARLHHCIADGIALASVLLSLTDDEPDVAPETTQDVVGHDLRDPRRPGLRRRVTEGTRDVAAVTGVDVIPRSLRQVATSLRFAWRVVSTGLGLVFATRDPRTRLSGRLGTRKVAAWSEPIDLGLVKRVAAALDATVNDVLLGVTAGALRRHLVDHGDRAHDLRIFVPVDLRPRDEPVPTTLGNRFGIVFIKLPVAEPDPVARVHAVHQRMSRVKAGAQAASTFAILAIVGALPSWGHRLAVRILGAKSTAIVTNVPGPREPVYLAGARLTRLVFWVPQAGSVGLGVSILSYAGDVTVGVAADHTLVPDPTELTRAVQDELAALVRQALPTDGEIVLQAAAFDSDLAMSLIDEVQQEYVRRYGGPDDTPVDPAQFAAPDGTFLVALLAGTAIGCAGMRRHLDGVVEIKRMFVRVEHRRRGHARRMLAALEDWARDRGHTRVVLETGAAQPEAIALYASAGYRPIKGFGHYKGAPLSRSFAKDL